jgi:hypothetical protein
MFELSMRWGRLASWTVALVCSFHLASVRADEVAESGDSLRVFSPSALGVAIGPSDMPEAQRGLEVSGFRLPESIFADAATMSGGGELPDRKDLSCPSWPHPGAPTAWPPRPLLSGLRNWDRPFMTKATRSLLTITGIELAAGVALAFLPQNFSRWDSDVLSRAMANLKRAWTTPPVWDEDIFFHNFLGHPYAGAFYYNMVRSQGATAWQSFGYALFQSTFWEYVLEAMAEQPSIQDLFITPVIGSLLGELFHSWSLRILRSGHLNFGEKALVFFLNPAYVVNNGFRRPE